MPAIPDTSSNEHTPSTTSSDKATWWVRSGITRLGFPLLITVILFFEGFLFHYYLIDQSRSPSEPRPEIATLLTFFTVLTLLPRRLSAFAGVALTAIYTGFWLFDSAYYRFFRDLPSWTLLPAWKQSVKASSSFSSVFKPTDTLVLLAPLLVLILAIAYVRYWKGKPQHGFLLPLGCLVLSVGSWGYVEYSLPAFRREQLQRRFKSMAIEQFFGPIFYHAYDTYEYLRSASKARISHPYDPQKVRALIEKSRHLSTASTPFKGMFQGRDLIFIQLESLEHFAIQAQVDGKPVMPFLHKVASEGYSFRIFDQTHLGRSSDGEFIYLNSLHPLADRTLAFTYPNNQFYGLPKLFQEKGYETVFIHPSDPTFWNARLLAKDYGFQELLYDTDLPKPDPVRDVRGWGLSDAALYSRVLDVFAQSPHPAFFYVVTLMCHHPYPDPPAVDTNFPSSQPLNMLRRYLRCCNARDQALNILVDKLAQSQRGRRAVICLLGDHDSNVDEADKAQAGYPIFPESEAVPMLLFTVEHAVTGQPMLKTQSKPPTTFGAQMDVAPSLGHVFSLPMEKSVFLGWNLFTKQPDGIRPARLGTWMDHEGHIRSPGDQSEPLTTDEFDVSDALLSEDKIRQVYDTF